MCRMPDITKHVGGNLHKEAICQGYAVNQNLEPHPIRQQEARPVAEDHFVCGDLRRRRAG